METLRSAGVNPLSEFPFTLRPAPPVFRMYARITGVGSYIPARRVSNAELEKIIPTNDAWIRENIGVVTRSVIAPGETTADMGSKAAAAALAQAKRDDIGLVICATNSPDTLYPATACRIAHNLGLGLVPGYDLQAGCTGFLYALAQAKPYVETSRKSVLVIGSDALSTGFLWHDDEATNQPSGDRNAVLFGDGAGAVVLSPDDRAGILAVETGAEYSEGIVLRTPYNSALNSPLKQLENHSARASAQGDYHTKMNGRAIMKLSLTHVPRAMDAVLRQAGLNARDVSVFLPHQTNKHVISKLADQIGYPVENIPDILSRYGSLSTAVIPVSLDMAQQAGQLVPNAAVLMTAYGAGFTFGAMVMRW